ncbi:hypothetical protein H0B56_09455 [Haloechinothrix sp. YIM 98757]|uniref:Extracellular solute-binding protein n=1 Tax=Haloechinothrix aidingensis TaxID=2752311 RepID=A0A838A8L9_9PSEU|nr:hypothetical protein [Haloechinothrix aidingensis]MBA0125765.1 hypothetical protein [Haloechinothrix aidingensis]
MVAAGLLAIGGVGWVWGTNAMNTRAEAQSQECEEHSTLHVLADEGIIDPLEAVAEEWNAGDEVVRAHCVTVQVTSANSEIAGETLAEADTDRDIPAVWIPASTGQVDTLADARSERIAAEPESVTGDGDGDYPLVRIQGPGVDDVQERAAQKFHTFVFEPDRRAVFDTLDEP